MQIRITYFTNDKDTKLKSQDSKIMWKVTNGNKKIKQCSFLL